MKSNRSKLIALSSAFVFALSIIALKFENTLGLFPILVAIVAFFICVIHTSMHLSGVTNGDVLGYFQQAYQEPMQPTETELQRKGEGSQDKNR